MLFCVGVPQDVADIQLMLFGCNIFDWRITGCFQMFDDVAARISRHARHGVRRMDVSDRVNQALIVSPTAPFQNVSDSSSPVAAHLNTSTESTEDAEEAAPLAWHALPQEAVVIQRRGGQSTHIGHKRTHSALDVNDC